MKKLFFPLVLLVACASADAQDIIEVDQNTAAQQAYLQAAGAQMRDNLLQNTDLNSWYYDEDNTTDDQRALFDGLALKYATLNLVVLEQNRPFYTQLFDELTALTGYNGWLVQLSFMSKEVAEALAAQQAAQDEDNSDESVDSVDSAE